MHAAIRVYQVPNDWYMHVVVTPNVLNLWPVDYTAKGAAMWGNTTLECPVTLDLEWQALETCSLSACVI